MDREGGHMIRASIRLSGVVAMVMLATSLAVAAPASAAAAPCGNRALTVRHTGVDGFAGHGAFFLLYENTSRSTCTLVGYPGLDALGRRGQVLAHATRTREGMAGGTPVI